MHKHYKALGIDTYDSFVDSTFEWACDTCLDEKKAIPARPELQAHAWTSHLAYHDTALVCRKCSVDFKFTKEEKRLWYEKLKFPGDAAPVNCLKCRSALKVLKAENKILSEIVRKPESEISVDELKIVADIYRNWDKVERAKFYDALIRKRLRGQKQR